MSHWREAVRAGGMFLVAVIVGLVVIVVCLYLLFGSRF